MLRHSFVLAIVFASVTAGNAAAQQWVEKMLSVQKHDFGTVARGADTVFKFPIKNIYKQDVELVSVRSSCGCTSPTLEGKLLKTGETGYVVASFNTRTFTGIHGATLTVTIAWFDNGIRRTGEAQMRVDGNIRGDVVFQPGAIRFENVDQGAASEQTAQVKYAGRGDWQVVDVRGATDEIEVELTERQRNAGQVVYDLLVRLKDSAPTGYFNQQLVLVTNDERNPRIPLHVEGHVVPGISVAPEPLVLGSVPRGETVSKRVVVRGKQPFRILKVEGNDELFQFKMDDESKATHYVEVVFSPKGDVGQVKQAIKIVTDKGESYHATLTAYATVVDSATGTAEREPTSAEVRRSAASAGAAGRDSVVGQD
jgi:hypothetical protein